MVGESVMNAESKEVNRVELDDLESRTLGQSAIDRSKISLIQDVNVSLDVCLGSTKLSVVELFDLKSNSIVKLESAADAPVDLLLNGKVVARGNLMLVDENFGVQITEILE